jgi:hypothetical protein
VLNMFRTLIYPSSGACDCVVESPHRSSCSQFVVCWRFGAAGFEWYSFCRLSAPTFRDNLSVSPSGFKNLRMGPDRLSRNVCKKLPLLVA